ncbi:MAG TPA: hypothetical protein VNO21_03850 [Polyangiaceae bacterium]|nr:hypothetical protein [Polyangiaceae bacterium]
MTAQRTTITLDARLLREVKKRAAERGTTIGGFIDGAIRRELEARPAKSKAFKLVVVGGKALIDTSPAGLAEFIENEDLETLHK